MSHSAQKKPGFCCFAISDARHRTASHQESRKTRRKLAEWRFTLLPGLPCRVFLLINR
jgi:hypothetical protein